MSELIQKNDNRATIRRKLLTGASALALTAYVASSGFANADDSGRPTLWIELGGQMELLQGLNAPFIAPFMALTPEPDIYKGADLIGSQNAPRFAFGEEGKITFQPEDSNWNLAFDIRYGRSHASRHTHRQAVPPPVPFDGSFYYTYAGYHYFYSSPNAGLHSFPSNRLLADTQTQNQERHLILDFTAGKDIGLGLFGRDGTSTVNAGVRIASFRIDSHAYITARPLVTGAITFYPTNFHAHTANHTGRPLFHESFRQYTMSAQAARSFQGIGPTLSWAASAALAGNPNDGELTVDWGINGALLFGKQKAKTNHRTTATKFFGQHYVGNLYPSKSNHSTRSRSVTVPNIGGSAGLSVKYPNFEFSLGYRYDTFLNAMDTGIDAAKKSNVTFNGPFASISIGLGD